MQLPPSPDGIALTDGNWAYYLTPPGTPPWPPRGDLLAFIYNREINIIRADGSSRQQIFTRPTG
jgi:hypothetical protein